jgi:hypothetical protein
VGVWVFFVTLIGSSMADFTENVPNYQASLLEQTAGLWTWLDAHGIHMDRSIVTERKIINFPICPIVVRYLVL